MLKQDQYEFIEFLCLPKAEQQKRWGFSTQDEFAKHIGVTPKTLSTWKASPKFQKEKQKMQRKLAGDSMSDVLAALKNSALEGDTGAIKIYLEYMGEMIKKSEISVSTEDVHVLVSDILEIIKRHVKDADVLNRIAEDIDELEFE